MLIVICHFNIWICYMSSYMKITEMSIFIKSFLEKTNNFSFWLISRDDGKFTLNVYHAYYFQIQAQLKFCHSHYCDFVVWRLSTVLVSSSSLHIMKLTGSIDCKIVYFCLTRPIIFSTWIQTWDSWREKSTSALLRCFFLE